MHPPRLAVISDDLIGLGRLTTAQCSSNPLYIASKPGFHVISSSPMLAFSLKACDSATPQAISIAIRTKKHVCLYDNFRNVSRKECLACSAIKYLQLYHFMTERKKDCDESRCVDFSNAYPTAIKSWLQACY